MCELTPAHDLELAFDLAAARRARTFLRGAVCRVHQSASSGDAELLVSELVANGVRHGAPPIVIHIECLAEAGLRVSVSDGAVVPPRLTRVEETEETAESGRGLQLVDFISDSWGVQQQPEGKTTWFRLSA